jgi:SAM-dependent methyltransferase
VTTSNQARLWSRHAAEYEEYFLDPYREGVVNPLWKALDSVADAKSKAVIDLGCGTGPLLPHLLERFGEVTALDFAKAMIKRSRQRLGEQADQVEFLNRSMYDLDDRRDCYDVAVAINSVVMPDVRDIDRALRAIRESLKPNGLFFGIVPAIDAVHYSTMLLMDRALDQGEDVDQAEAKAAEAVEHHLFDFEFGRFRFQGLHQKFWNPFEIEYRLRKAGFRSIALEKLLYPWDDDMAGGPAFSECDPSWDWTFTARR